MPKAKATKQETAEVQEPEETREEEPVETEVVEPEETGEEEPEETQVEEPVATEVQRLEVEVSKIREVLDLVKPVIPRKPNLAILTNVLLHDGVAVAGDLESAIEVSLPGAKEPLLLPYDAVSKLLRYVPGYERATLILDSSRRLKISWSDGMAAYMVDKAEDYPQPPEQAVTAEAEIAGDQFIAALSSLLPYVATETSRPVLSGITVVFGKENVQLAAGDGFRMAYHVIPLEFPVEQTVVIPASAVSHILHLWAKTPRTPPESDSLIPVITAKKKILLSVVGDNALIVGYGPSARIIVKLTQGSPPDWLRLIPKDAPTLVARVMGSEFERAIRRVCEVSNTIRLEFANQTMTVSAKNEGNEAQAIVPLIDMEGEPNKTGLNGGYLLSYLSGRQGIITLSMTSPSAPVSLHHQSTPKVIIMPMNVN